MAQRRNGVGTSLGVALVKFSALPVSLLTAVYLARSLGPDEFGVYSMTISLATVAAIFLGTGFNQFLLRETAQSIQFGRLGLLHGLLRRVRQIWLCGTFLLMLMAVSFYFTIRASGNVVPVSLVWGVVLLAPMLGALAILTGLLQALKSPVVAQFSNLLLKPAAGLLIAFTIGIVAHLTVLQAVIAQVLGAMLAIILSLFYFSRKCPKDTWTTSAEYNDLTWSHALLPFALLTLASSFNNELGIIMLGWLGEPSEVGGLRAAQSAAQLVSFPQIIGNMLLAPHVAILSKGKNRAEMRRIFVTAARFSFLIGLCIGFPMIVWGEELITLIFGAEFSSLAFKPLIILVGAQLTNVFFGQTGMYLTMSGYEKETLKGQVLALIFLFLSALVLIPSFGAIGAALSVAIGLITWNTVLGWKLYQKLRIRPTIF
jgi:O-antigen/teichoic acid export membrane protein